MRLDPRDVALCLGHGEDLAARGGAISPGCQTSFVATALMSLCTGTSFGSAGTIGVAMMGLGAATGAPLAPLAGAVVSGAYLGDKMSPLSDTTNVCALAASADLYRHVRHMLYTALPSAAVALTVYSFLGGGASQPAAGGGAALLAELERGFRLTPVTLLPAALAIAAMLRGIPAVLAISLSSATAVVIGLTLQGFSIEVAAAAAVSGFRPEMLAQRDSTRPAPARRSWPWSSAGASSRWRRRC